MTARIQPCGTLKRADASATKRPYGSPAELLSVGSKKIAGRTQL